MNEFFEVPPDFTGEVRLDTYIAKTLGILNRSQIKTRKLTASINGGAVKLSRPVRAGDRLELSWQNEADEYLVPENIPLRIIFEDGNCVVMNKAQGMVVHPGAGNKSGTLANALAYRRRLRRGAGDTDLREGPRTGIVHRLDKDTSGVIIAAYTGEALAFLAAQFRARAVDKRYLALVRGVPALERGKIEGLIARKAADRRRFCLVPSAAADARVFSGAARGRYSFTFYRVVKKWNAYSLLLLIPKTGRTHQLRVHLKSIGCPILGDPLYGRSDKNFPGAGLMLHAWRLSITVPGAAAPSCFTAPLPLRFKRIVDALDAVVK
ncbi:MAG: RluA family pseudouridine synthase [Treponema sp.]|jgi:23S rRNA pseudouridine1911/1915/1917 synthase|nr:RluA family pseudouridine synthase [Treponema sp.]